MEEDHRGPLGLSGDLAHWLEAKPTEQQGLVDVSIKAVPVYEDSLKRIPPSPKGQDLQYQHLLRGERWDRKDPGGLIFKVGRGRGDTKEPEKKIKSGGKNKSTGSGKLMGGNQCG